MYLRQLIYLRAIIDRGTYAAAAASAGVTQSAVSQAVQALEQAFGVRLFETRGRSRMPTPAAILLAKHAAEFEMGVSAVSRQGDAKQSSTRAGGELRVGMSPAAALLFGPQVVRLWQQSGAGGAVRIGGGDSRELLKQLRRGELDLVVAPRPRGGKLRLIQVRMLYRSVPTICARIGHPRASATSLSELSDVDWVVVGEADSPGGIIAEAHRVRKLRPPRLLARCPDYRTLLHLIAESDMMGVVPHAALIDEGAARRVVAVHIREGLPRYEVCLFRGPHGIPVESVAVDTVIAALGATVLE